MSESPKNEGLANPTEKKDPDPVNIQRDVENRSRTREEIAAKIDYFIAIIQNFSSTQRIWAVIFGVLILIIAVALLQPSPRREYTEGGALGSCNSELSKQLHEQSETMIKRGKKLLEQEKETQSLRKTLTSWYTELSKQLHEQSETMKKQSKKILEQGKETQSLRSSLSELKKALMRNDAIKESLCYVGMKSGAIPDKAITATSVGPHAVNAARLHSGSGWTPQQHNIGQWIQIQLEVPQPLAGVVTQGNRNGYFVKLFKVQCGTDEDNLEFVKENGRDKIFQGNIDSNAMVVSKFPKVMICRYVRLYPQEWHNSIGLRFEILHGVCFDMF